MVVFAAPAVSTLFVPQRALAVGGAMIIAGAALLPGGSPLGLLMLMPGIAIGWAGIRSRPADPSPGWMRLIATAIALVAAVYLALDEGVMTGLMAIVLAIVAGVVNSRN